MPNVSYFFRPINDKTTESVYSKDMSALSKQDIEKIYENLQAKDQNYCQYSRCLH